MGKYAKTIVTVAVGTLATVFTGLKAAGADGTISTGDWLNIATTAITGLVSSVAVFSVPNHDPNAGK